eukprot:6510720-Karenia_brevis.AAC.1
MASSQLQVQQLQEQSNRRDQMMLAALSKMTSKPNIEMKEEVEDQAGNAGNVAGGAASSDGPFIEEINTEDEE